MTLPILFDAALFDLDGTLVATEGFWVAAARAGARRAFEELALQRELPDADAWLSMVGLPLAHGFANVFPDLTEVQRARVMACCVEEEERAVRAGQAALLPGAREVLIELRERGLKLGIASNCSAGYLERMLIDLELGQLVDQARCLDSKGVRNKADMVADLLRAFGTRRAVMIGDRASDAEAAHASALAHVHLSQGLAPKGEKVEAEAVIPDLRGLVPLLERRAEWIERALIRSGVLDSSGRKLRAKSLGITGRSASGTTGFADDVARLLRERSLDSVVVHLADYARADCAADAAEVGAPLEFVERAFDVDGLIDGVLAPHARGEAALARRGGVPIAPSALVVVEGAFLLAPRWRAALERVLYLEVAEGTSLKRIAAREADPEAVLRARKHRLPLERRFEELVDPKSRADAWISSENPLGTPAPAL